MASSVGDLLVNLGINVSGFTSGLGAAENAMVQAGTRMYFLGARIAAGFGAPLALAVGAIANFGIEFDAAMTESLAIMNDVTPAIRKQMEETAKTIGETSTFSSAQAAKAYYNLASAGYDAQESMKLLPVVTRFAQAGVMDLAKATDYLSTAQMAMGMYIKGDYQKNMEEMTRISDVLTEANNRSVGTVQQFAEALTNKAGQSLRFFGKSVEEGVAALAMLHQQGTIGKAAGQQLFMVIRDLGVYSLKFADVWKKNGITVYDAAGKMRNLADIMKDLENRTEGMSDKGKRMLLMMLGIPQRSISATIALMKTADAMKEMQIALENAGGATEKVAAKQLESFKNQLIMLKNQGVNVLINLFGQFSDTINNTLIPALKSLLAHGKAMAEWLGGLSEGWKKALVYIGTFLVALGPAIMLFGSMTLAIRGIVGIFTTLGGILGGTAIRLGIVLGLLPAIRTGALTGAAALAAYGTGLKTAGGAAGLLGISMGSLASSTLVVGGALAILGYGIYKLVKSSDTLRSSLDLDAKAFNDKTKSITEAVKAYDKYWMNQSKIGLGPQGKEEVAEYDKAIRSMAEALGLSEQQMRDELATSNDLLDSLREQIKLRRELAQEARLQEVATAGNYEAQITELRAKYKDLYSGKPVTTYEFMPDVEGGGQYIPKTKVPTPQERASMGASYLRQIEDLARQRDAILNSSKWTRGADIVLEGPKKPATPGGPPEEDPEVLKKKEAVDAYKKSVEEMAGFLAGEGKRSFDILKDAWASLTLVQQESPDVLERVYEAYEKIRPTLSKDEIPADIEFMTSALREQENMFLEWNSMSGTVAEGMGHMTTAGDKLREQMGALEWQFDRVNGVVDPKWYKAHADGLDELLLDYDRMPPKIKKLLDGYRAWKVAAEAAGDASTKSARTLAASIAEAAAEMEASVKDANIELLGFTLGAGDRELVGMKKGLEELKVKHAQTFASMMNDVAKKTGLDHQLAIDNALMYRDWATQLETIKEKTELLRAASSLGADRTTLWWLSTKNIDTITKFVQLLGKLYERLVTVSRFTNSIRAVGEAFSAWGATRVGEWLTQTADLMDRAAKAGATLAEGLSSNRIDKIIQGLAGIAAAFGEISQMATRSERAISGAMAGASAGFAVGGPWGALAGGIFGGLAGAMMPDPGWARIQEEVRKNYGMAIEKGVAQAIADVKSKHKWMSDQMATIFSLDTLIDQEGGVNDATIDTWSKRLGEMFSIWAQYQKDMDALMAKQRTLNASVPGTDPNFGLEEKMEQLGKAAADLQDTFDRVFPKIAEAVVKSGKIASKEFLNLIQLMRATGLESQALAEFAASQLSRFTSAWDAVAGPLIKFTTDLQASKDKLKEFNEEMEKSGKYDPKTGKYKDLGIEEQKELAEILKEIEDLYKKDTHAAAEAAEEAERLGRLLMAAFNGAIESGMDLFAAFDAIGPQLDALIQIYKTLGIESDNAALSQLMHMRQLINDNPELIAGVRALNDMTLALSNLGGLTAETLADLEAQGMHMYERMISAGFTEQQTLAAMVPWLRTIYDAHKKLGIPIDENTQKLIDQATKLGLLDENDPTVILKQGFKDLIQAVKDLTAALLGIPSTIDSTVNVHTNYTASGSKEPPDDSGGTEPPQAQSQGGYYRVSGPTQFIAGEAGPEEVVFSGANNALNGNLFNEGGAGRGAGTVIVKVGPKTLAEILVPEIPGVVREYGLGR